MKRNTVRKIGIDEVGRGAVAGPVMVGVAIWLKGDINKFVEKNKDSKKLTEKKREEMYKTFLTLKEKGMLDFYTSKVNSKYIDKFGINKSLLKASGRVLSKIKRYKGTRILSDYGLPVPVEYRVKYIVKGDELEPIISIASIVAKVERDRLLRKEAERYLNYRFEKNKGYGTKEHMNAIKKHGLSEIHRVSFLRKCR